MMIAQRPRQQQQEGLGFLQFLAPIVGAAAGSLFSGGGGGSKSAAPAAAPAASTSGPSTSQREQLRDIRDLISTINRNELERRYVDGLVSAANRQSAPPQPRQDMTTPLIIAGSVAALLVGVAVATRRR